MAEGKKDGLDLTSEQARRQLKLVLLELLASDSDVRAEFDKFITVRIETVLAHEALRPTPSRQPLTALDAATARDILRLIEEKLRQHLRPEGFRKPL